MRWLLLVLAGCGSDGIWHGDTAFTASEREIVVAGAAFTAAAIGTTAPVIVWGGKGDHMIFKREPRRLSGAVATGSPYTIEIGPKYVRIGVVAHEFGHAYGLPHLAEGVSGLMQPTVHPILAWTEADQASCEAAGVCKEEIR